MPICGAQIDQCTVTQYASLTPWAPMSGSFSWRNYAFPRGTTIVAGFLLGVYDEAIASFRAWVFELEGNSYIWGALWFEEVAQDPESVMQHAEQMYSFDLPGAQVCSAMAFLAQPQDINVLKGDWGYGERICAISWDDFVSLSLIDKCVFRHLLSVSDD